VRDRSRAPAYRRRELAVNWRRVLFEEALDVGTFGTIARCHHRVPKQSESLPRSGRRPLEADDQAGRLSVYAVNSSPELVREAVGAVAPQPGDRRGLFRSGWVRASGAISRSADDVRWLVFYRT